jgi:hypothetical protein
LTQSTNITEKQWISQRDSVQLNNDKNKGINKKQKQWRSQIKKSTTKTTGNQEVDVTWNARDDNQIASQLQYYQQRLNSLPKKKEPVRMSPPSRIAVTTTKEKLRPMATNNKKYIYHDNKWWVSDMVTGQGMQQSTQERRLLRWEEPTKSKANVMETIGVW